MRKQCKSKTSMMRKTWISVVASSLLLTQAKAIDANALPTGGQVVHGNVAISRSNNTMNINQSSQKAIVNWNTFNVGANATVNFIQPNASSVILNRVISATPSTINGRINANGQVFLVNPNGIIFGQNSRVDVGGLVASTMNITNENFLNGNYTFFGNNKNATIKNYGTLSAKINGYIALLAPEVINEGVIIAQGGSIAIGGGNKATLNFDGLNIVSLEVENAVLDSLIENKHLISAEDGTIIMSVEAANTLHAAVINNEGIIEANNLTSENGKILLTATGENSVITNSAVISSSSATTDGGEIRIVSDKEVNLTNTSIVTAEGNNGGFLAVASQSTLNLDGTYSVKSNASKENGWLYTGNNTDAALFMRNPNAEGAGVQSENTTVIFEENLGQTDESIDFLTRADSATMYLSAAEAFIAMQENLTTMQLKDANDEAAAIGEDVLQSYSNYFIGNDESKWLEGVKHYKTVRYVNIYDGIDLVYYGNENGDIEYDLVANAGSNIEQIQFDYSKANSVTINQYGDIVIQNGDETFIQKAPLTYQKETNAKRIVPSSYELNTTTKEVKIKTDSYDTNKELIVDPVVEWSTYYGGNGIDESKAIAIDNGNLYITGSTTSSDFNTNNASQDAFISKVSTDGALLWSTFFGGSFMEEGTGITVDNNSNIYVSGYTDSSDFNTINGFQTTYGTNMDSFITKFSSNGSILWSSYLGGSFMDEATDIVTDSNNNIYITGNTNSSDFNTSGGFQTVTGGFGDAFITKISSNGSLIWSSYLGGTSLERSAGISVDNSDNVYITGDTGSNNFNTLKGFQTTLNGSVDSFITKFSSNGTILWSSYLGGSSFEDATDIAIDSNNNIYITGNTDSLDFNTSGGFQTVSGGLNDVYITKLSSNGTILWSSYLGGNMSDSSRSIIINNSNNIYITGNTSSSDFNIKNGLQTTLNNFQDAFITKVSSQGAIIWSSYFGGSLSDTGFALTVDSNDNIYLVGSSDSTDFPITNAFQTSNNGFIDGFITKIQGNMAPSLDTSVYGGNTLTGGIKTHSTNDTTNIGYSINQLISDGGNSFINDVDSLSVGIAVTNIDNTGGTWQYSLNGGSSWINIPNVSDSNALLLSNSSTTKVRFVPDGNLSLNETISRSIAFFAWDGTVGANGDTNVDVNTRGGTTSFSTDWARAYYKVIGTTEEINDPAPEEGTIPPEEIDDPAPEEDTTPPQDIYDPVPEEDTTPPEEIDDPAPEDGNVSPSPNQPVLNSYIDTYFNDPTNIILENSLIVKDEILSYLNDVDLSSTDARNIQKIDSLIAPDFYADSNMFYNSFSSDTDGNIVINNDNSSILSNKVIATLSPETLIALESLKNESFHQNGVNLFGFEMTDGIDYNIGKMVIDGILSEAGNTEYQDAYLSSTAATRAGLLENNPYEVPQLIDNIEYPGEANFTIALSNSAQSLVASGVDVIKRATTSAAQTVTNAIESDTVINQIESNASSKISTLKDEVSKIKTDALDSIQVNSSTLKEVLLKTRSAKEYESGINIATSAQDTIKSITTLASVSKDLAGNLVNNEPMTGSIIDLVSETQMLAFKLTEFTAAILHEDVDAVSNMKTVVSILQKVKSVTENYDKVITYNQISQGLSESKYKSENTIRMINKMSKLHQTKALNDMYGIVSDAAGLISELSKMKKIESIKGWSDLIVGGGLNTKMEFDNQSMANNLLYSQNLATEYRMKTPDFKREHLDAVQDIITNINTN